MYEKHKSRSCTVPVFFTNNHDASPPPRFQALPFTYIPHIPYYLRFSASCMASGSEISDSRKQFKFSASQFLPNQFQWYVLSCRHEWETGKLCRITLMVIHTPWLLELWFWEFWIAQITLQYLQVLLRYIICTSNHFVRSGTRRRIVNLKKVFMNNVMPVL